MNARQLIASGAMALLLAPAAFANSANAHTASPGSCKTLETRFDREAQNSHVTNLTKARYLRTAGAELCSQGKSIEGARKLEEAVKMLGETPARN